MIAHHGKRRRTSRRWMGALMSLLLLGGCAGGGGGAHAGEHVGGATTEPAPVAGAPSESDHPLRLADAVPLEKLETDGAAGNLHTKLRLARGGTLYFGALETTDDDDNLTSSVPLIAKRSGDDYVALRIDDDRLNNAGWTFVAAGPKRGEVWGALDAATDNDLQRDLLMAHTTDGGKTWTLSAIRKPTAAAVFDSFCMGPDGHGRVSLYVSGEDPATEKPGYYHLRTTDGGKTWSKPEYEPDAMVPGKQVDEDDDEEDGHPDGVARHVNLRVRAGSAAALKCHRLEVAG